MEAVGDDNTRQDSITEHGFPTARGGLSMSDVRPPSTTPTIHDHLEHWVACWRWPVHYLKTVQPFYAAITGGFKNFEVRRDDRNYQASDLLVLCEWTGEEFTGEQSVRKVIYVLRDAQEFGVQEGFVVLGLDFPTKYDLGARVDKGSQETGEPRG